MTPEYVKLSLEQETLINSQSDFICCIAYSGTGKTFVLNKMAERCSKDRILYLAYNKAIQLEALQKFPRNTKVLTVHSMAYRYYKNLRKKLKPNFNFMDLKKTLSIPSDAEAVVVYSALQTFYQSADEHLTLDCVPLTDAQNKKIREDVRIRCVVYAQRAFKMQQDENNPFPCTFDFYVKHFQLDAPPLGSWFDLVLLDEAQDSNHVTGAILAKCECRRIYVGDPHQMIYRWRGSYDILSQQVKAGAEIVRLTNSFRFGSNISRIANVILKAKGENVPIKAIKTDQILTRENVKDIFPRTIISRTNLSMILNAIDITASGKKVFFVGGGSKLNIDSLIDYYHLKTEPEKIKDKTILEKFESWSNFCEITELSNDFTSKNIISLIDEHGEGVIEMVSSIFQKLTPTEQEADVILVTAHSSKGLEWECVELDNDFVSALSIIDTAKSKRQKIPTEYIIDELNLLYVAVTRATQFLTINSAVYDLILYARYQKDKKEFTPLVQTEELRPAE